MLVFVLLKFNSRADHGNKLVQTLPDCLHGEVRQNGCVVQRGVYAP
jgi:hypothetical protein